MDESLDPRLARRHTGTAIRRPEPTEINSLVDIHMASFQGFFLTFLGPAFLRIFYGAVLRDPSGIFFAAMDSNQPRGFVAGTTRPAGFYRRILRKHWWSFAISAIPAVLRRPRIIVRLVRALSLPSQVTQDPSRGTLMSLAVLPRAQGLGLGRALVVAFLDESRAHGVTHVDLTTDATNNEPANRFYQKLGFSKLRSFTTPEGRAMNEYSIATVTNEQRKRYPTS